MFNSFRAVGGADNMYCGIAMPHIEKLLCAAPTKPPVDLVEEGTVKWQDGSSFDP